MVAEAADAFLFRCSTRNKHFHESNHFLGVQGSMMQSVVSLSNKEELYCLCQPHSVVKFRWGFFSSYGSSGPDFLASEEILWVNQSLSLSFSSFDEAYFSYKNCTNLKHIIWWSLIYMYVYETRLLHYQKPFILVINISINPQKFHHPPATCNLSLQSYLSSPRENTGLFRDSQEEWS